MTPSQLIALLNSYRPNDRLYVSLSRVEERLYVAGKPLPNLPPSYRALLGSKRVQGDVARHRLDGFLELEIPE